MHQVISYTPLIESLCDLFYALYGLDKAVSCKLMQTTTVPWLPLSPSNRQGNRKGDGPDAGSAQGMMAAGK